MAESSGGGELAVGLSELRKAKDRLNRSDGLNQQVEFNQKQLRLRTVASCYALIFFAVLYSWMVGMPALIRYSLLLIATFVCVVLIVKRRKYKLDLARVREQQLEDFRRSQIKE